MGIDLTAWRARIGTFSQRGRKSRFVAPAIVVGKLSLLIRLVTILACMVVIAGDVETNPGPQTGNNAAKKGTLSQSRLSFDPETARRTTRNSASVAMDADRHVENRATQQQQVNENSNQADVLRSILEQISQVNSKLDSIDKKIDREVAELRRDNDILNQRVIDLEEQHDMLESQSRRNNLIYHGIADSTQGRETWEETEVKVRDFMVDNLELTREDSDGIAIERAHRLPGRRGNRPVIVKFLSYKDKDRVLRRAREKLRDSKDFSVREDFTKRVRETRSKLYTFMRDAREKGHLATMSFDKLRINGVMYRYDWSLDDIVPIHRSPYQGDTRDRDQSVRVGEDRR